MTVTISALVMLRSCMSSALAAVLQLRVPSTRCFATALVRPSLPQRTTVSAPLLRSSAAFQRRSMFIRTQDTPNPKSLKFLPGKPILLAGQGNSADFSSFRAAQKSPLARRLFKIEGVTGVFFGPDFVTVTIGEAEGPPWSIVRPDVFSALQEHFGSGEQAVSEQAPVSDTAIQPEDSEAVAMIKELIETRIRPTVQDDGGDIVYHGLDKDGIVWLEMQGSCKGCPSSAVTLKNGIENMLTHYVPEVKEVKEWIDEEIQGVHQQMLGRIVDHDAAAGSK